MTSHVAITTFGPQHYHRYGRQFLQSFLQHWDVPLVCFVELPIDFTHPRLEVRMLTDDPDYRAFLHEYDQEPYRGHPGFPNGQLIRFCHKVFAMTASVQEADWTIWLDADVITTRTVNQEALDELCPSDVDLCYLGRQHIKQWPETGFLAFRGMGKRILDRMRELYVSGEIVKLPQNHWHDAAAFEVSRRKSLHIVPELNLSKDIVPPDGLHVWPLTRLERYMSHAKGERRKRLVYG